MGKYFICGLFGLEFSPCVLLNFIQFLSTFWYNLYVLCRVSLNSEVSYIFSVVLLTGKQVASECLSVKSNKK